MIKLRDYLDSRKLTVEQFNQAPDFAFGVFIKDPDDKLVRVKDIIPFMGADIVEVNESLKFGNAEMELTKLTIVVHLDNKRATNIVCVLDKLNKIKFDIVHGGSRLSEAQILKLVNNSIGLLEDVAL